MASTSTIRKRSNGSGHANDVVLDLETRAIEGDHQALRLWLRLLSCTVRIENKIRLRLRREFNTTLPRFERAFPAHDGLRRQRDRNYRPART